MNRETMETQIVATVEQIDRAHERFQALGGNVLHLSDRANDHGTKTIVGGGDSPISTLETGFKDGVSSFTLDARDEQGRQEFASAYSTQPESPLDMLHVFVDTNRNGVTQTTERTTEISGRPNGKQKIYPHEALPEARSMAASHLLQARREAIENGTYDPRTAHRNKIRAERTAARAASQAKS